MIADYAEVLIQTKDNLIDEEVNRLLVQALELDRDNQKALWFAGLGAFRAGDYGVATRHWEHLHRLVDHNTEMAQMLSGAIEEAKVRSGELEVLPEKEPEGVEAGPAEGETAGPAPAQPAAG